MNNINKYYQYKIDEQREKEIEIANYVKELRKFEGPDNYYVKFDKISKANFKKEIEKKNKRKARDY